MGYTSKSQGIWRGLESGGQWPPSVFDKVFEVAMNFFLLSFPRNWVKYEILSIYLFTTPRLWRCKWKKITSRAPNNENRQWLMVIWEWESHQPRILMLSFRLWRFTNHLLTYLLVLLQCIDTDTNNEAVSAITCTFITLERNILAQNRI